MYRTSIFNPEDKLSELRKEDEIYEQEYERYEEERERKRNILVARGERIKNEQHKKIFHFLIDELFNCKCEDTKPVIKELINHLWKNL